MSSAADLIQLHFSDGFSARLEALYVQETYLGFLEGRPQLGFNQKVLGRAMTQMEGLWGRRKTHVVEPPTYWTDTDHEWLPQWQLFMWLRCPRAVQHEFGQSDLVLVIFHQKIGIAPLQELLQDSVGFLSWGDYAQDFESD